MATVERPPPRAPSRQASLQRMLELEKKYKMERLQGQNMSPASTPPPVSYNNRPPLVTRRSDSLAHYQQNYLMLKAVQRSVALPSLSVTIPQDSGDDKRGLPTQNTADKENRVDKETAGEPLQKQVKFLAPDDDDLSDQSSICQSPSWEGYGQKKKEKKLELERKKKEKEQQDRETKAAKRRLAARLSKAPPRTSIAQPTAPFANVERSMSDPLLISRQLEPGGPFSKSSGHIEQRLGSGEGRRPLTSSFEDAEPPVAAEDQNKEFIGGLKLEQERQMALQNAIAQQAMALSSSIPKSRPNARKYYSMGPITSLPDTAQVSTAKDSRQSRDLHPPSASRTPMLRQGAPSSHGRSNSLLSGASKIFRPRERSQQRQAHPNNSQESVHIIPSSTDRGRQSNSYVQHQRDQSKERAMAGFVDEQASNNATPQEASARANTRQGFSRRPSLTIDAKSVAMRFSGLRSTPGSKGNANGHGRSQSSSQDYFTFLDQPYSPPALELLSPIGSLPASMREKASPRGAPAPEEPEPATEAHEPGSEVHEPQDLYEPAEHPPAHTRDSTYSKQFLFPTTSLQPVILSAPSSRAPSIASSGSAPSKKGRSLKDAFASLSIHRGSMPPTPNEGSNPRSPNFQFRSRMSTSSYGSTSAAQITSAPMALSPPLATLQLPPKAARVLGEYNEANGTSEQPAPSTSAPTKSTAIPPNSGGRASEGSSSSSAYDDGSPLPSPATTPDTSRPQSSKGLSAAVDPMARQDDEKTLREASDSSGIPTRTVTPRLEVSKPLEDKAMPEEDGWSRTALPLELDFDAQSFVTSLSNLDNIDSIDEELAKARMMATSPRAELLAAHAAKAKTKEQSRQEPLGSLEESHKSRGMLSTPELGNLTETAAGVGLVFGINDIPIPMRSKKRDQLDERPSTAPVDFSTSLSTHEPKEKARETRELKSFKEYQSQSASVAKQEAKLERSRETIRKDSRQVKAAETPVSPKEDLHKPKRQQKNDQLREVAKENDLQPDTERKKQSNASTEASSSSTLTPQRTSTVKSVDTTSSSVYSSGGVSSSPPASFWDRKAASAPVSAPESPRSKSPSPSVEPSSSPHPVQESTSYPRPAQAPQPVRQVAKTVSSVSAPATPAASSNSRAVGNGPVSILKQTSRSQSPPPVQGGTHRGPVLSALPKHMQLQAGISTRPPVSTADQRVMPVAKMFVECCSCKFYHDMPSKLYECMAKPDSVVEDKMLGISGAITTMVKCPWCAHNMSTQCCAGYAAVVYLKERLH